MIRAVLDQLTDQERKRLMYAFENEFSQFVELPMGMFIGVNAQHIKHLEITESAGKWSYGSIKGKL